MLRDVFDVFLTLCYIIFFIIQNGDGSLDISFSFRECSDVISIDEVVDNAKTSQHFQDLRQEVEDLLENIKRLRTDREENLTTVNDQVQKHIMKVQNLRSKYLVSEYQYCT
jgi:hypothetical protein